jgi:hypothetical protein
VEHRGLVFILLALFGAMGLAGYWAVRAHCEKQHCEHGRAIYMNYQCFCAEKPK